MEEPVKDQSSAPAIKVGLSSKLRYPLRSATKSKEEKPRAAELSNSSAPKRGRPLSSVSKSVGVLELSGKDKSGKPPRRLSIPAKSIVSPLPRSFGNITPISESRAKRSANGPAKNDTPVSDVSRSSSQRKFSVLSSASYWLSQIKLSESAAKHNISLGFFKLALEAGCETVHRMRDELKAYARRHNLAELGEPAKELFDSYNILENFEQTQISETLSQVFEEGTHSSDEDVNSSSSVTRTMKLKPRSLNTDATAQTSPPLIESGKKNANQKDNFNAKTRGPLNKNPANTRSISGNARGNISKKSQKPNKQGSNIDKGNKTQKQGKKVLFEKGSADQPVDEPPQEDKENRDAPRMEEITVA